MCTNYEFVIVKFCKLLLKFETGNEQVREFELKWAWRVELRVGLKSCSLQENVYKRMHHWSMSPERFCGIDGDTLNLCCKCGQEGAFF